MTASMHRPSVMCHLLVAQPSPPHHLSHPTGDRATASDSTRHTSASVCYHLLTTSPRQTALRCHQHTALFILSLQSPLSSFSRLPSSPCTFSSLPTSSLAMRSLMSIGKHLMSGKYDKQSQWKPEMGSLYDLKVNDLDGKPFDLTALKGKVSLICNVASECGYTKCGYQFLQEEQAKYGGRHFTVLGFPCNQFGGQESGGPQDIRESPHATHPTPRLHSHHPHHHHLLSYPAYSLTSSPPSLSALFSFAVKSFHVTFPLLEKTDVNGANTHPVFQYLKQVYPGDVNWNFHGLFVVNEEGIPIRRFNKEPYPVIDEFIGKALDERDAHQHSTGSSTSSTSTTSTTTTASTDSTTA